MEYRVIRPLDILHLRGNRLFADAGHGEAVMPPWPSLFAGALRSRIMADRNISFAGFRDGTVSDEEICRVIGREPDKPGTFRVGAVALVGPDVTESRAANSNGNPCTLYFPCPADLFACAADDGGIELTPLLPGPAESCGAAWKSALPRPVLMRSTARRKPAGGVWLTLRALMAHLRGQPVPAAQAVRASALWLSDPRLGIALESGRRTAREGLLYTTEAVALAAGVGFLVGCDGTGDLLPNDGLLRLGGDARGASVAAAPMDLVTGDLPWGHTPAASRFRLTLATPGCFSGGWLPGAVTAGADGRHMLRAGGLVAELVAAAVPGAGVVSGWDLARQRPKPAMRVVPPGATYWFEMREGDRASLAHLRDGGLWSPDEDRQPWAATRRAEGFNNAWLGEWHDEHGN